MLILTRREGQRVIVDDDIAVKVLSIDGNTVRLGFDAPGDVSIWREEIYRRMEAERENESADS